MNNYKIIEDAKYAAHKITEVGFYVCIIIIMLLIEDQHGS